MKKLIAFILALTLVMSLVACASADATQECEPEKRFEVVYGGGLGPTIYVDTETGVMYLLIRPGNAGGLTVMINADGTPMIWEGYSE